MKFSSLAERSIPLLLFVYPILLLPLRGGVDWCFALLVLLSIYRLASVRTQPAEKTWDRTALIYLVSMLSLVLATFLSQTYHLQFNSHPYDGASRFLFAVPIYLMLRREPPATLKTLQYGFPLGAIVSPFILWFDPKNWGDNRLGSSFLNPIHFGDLALILGFLSVLSIDWGRKDPWSVRSLKITGLIAGVSASLITGSRGGWLAIPALLIIWLYYRGRHNSAARNATIILLALFAAASLYLFVPEVHRRIDSVFQNIAAYGHQNEDTSIGIRFQIWKAAVLLILKNPLFGLGPDQFKYMMMPLYHAGVITRTAAEYGQGEVHSEILVHTVNLGIFGLVSILLIYFGPLLLFIRSARSASHPGHAAAVMGICLATGFIIFGLTVETFDLKMTATFYSLTVAVLLAAATNRRVPDDSGSGRNEA